MEKKEPMSVGFAVFNGHVNDASKKARAHMALHFPHLLSELSEIEKKHNGIMGIFNEEPTTATAMFASLVTYLVNEDLSKQGDPSPDDTGRPITDDDVKVLALALQEIEEASPDYGMPPPFSHFERVAREKLGLMRRRVNLTMSKSV